MPCHTSHSSPRKAWAFCAGAFEEEELEGFIFSGKPLCAKLRMLEHLQMIGSEVPRRYLSKKYGPDGSALLASQDAIEIHDMLRPLLVSCDRDLAMRCDEAILFGSLVHRPQGLLPVQSR